MMTNKPLWQWWEEIHEELLERIADEVIQTVSGWQQERQDKFYGDESYAKGCISDWYSTEYHITDTDIDEIFNQVKE